MSDWFDVLSSVIGIVVSLFFIVLTILTIVGIPLGVLAAGLAFLISVL